MLIHRLQRDSFSEAYGIRCQSVHPWQDQTAAPFAATWCVVEPGKVARAHEHHEHEVFVIMSGRGLMRVDDETTEVGPGDVIFIPAWGVHELTNLDAEEDLCFLDLCWEKMDEAVDRNPSSTAGPAGERSRPRSVLLTVTPPTPNGDLHLGHLSGPYLGADVCRRYLRMLGVDARYLTGMDDHQSYVVTKGEKLGWTPRQVADHFSDRMCATFAAMRIDIDHVARPQTSRHHVELARKVFLALVERGAIYAKKAPTLYCESCQLFLFEAHVDGGCPHCPAASGGNACEACGRPNDCADLREPHCHHCGGEPSVREIERFYFPLEPHRERLERFWAEARMDPHMRSLCQTMLEAGLPEIAVSHPSDWGIPVPVEGFSDQRIYVWFEMAAGYLAAAHDLWRQDGDGEDWQGLGGERAWGPAAADLVQFFGFDNGYFHALLFPAVFNAYDPQIPLPTALVTNEMYRYEGSKFSTSRNHAMWGDELLAEVPADVARFYLAWDRPETEQSNFRHASFQHMVQSELIEGWQDWLADLGARLRQRFGGKVPGTGAWTEEHRRFHSTILALVQDAANAYEVDTFSLQRAARVLSELVHEARRFGHSEQHWHGIATRYEEERTAMALELWAARVLAQIAAPLMPGFAAALRHDLGDDNLGWEDTPGFLASGQTLDELGRPAYFESRSELISA